MSWVEGLPTEPGDYWFYKTWPGNKNLSGVIQGTARPMSDGRLMCIAQDFVREDNFNGTTKRVWHKKLTLPEPPDFDRTCPTCEGKKSYRSCFDCGDTGEL